MNLQGIKNRIRKVLAYTVTAILFIIISSFLVLQMPPVQNFLVGKYLKSLTNITGFKSTIKSFRILWFDRLELDGVSIYDPENNKMIGVKKLLINFKLMHLLSHEDIDLDGLFVDSAQVLLTKINASDTSRYLNINVFIDRISERYSSSDTLTTGGSIKINIGEATVEQSSFIYINPDEDSVKQGFDYFHFALDVDEGHLEKFTIQGDTTEFKVTTLIVKDRETQFGVNQLSTFFRICQKSMEYRGINLKAGESTVTDTIIFTYDKMTDLVDFVDKVKIHANLKDCIIEPKDLAVFAPGVEPLGQVVRLNGVINGTVDKFKYSDMYFEIGDTKLYGSLQMEGLPDIYETFIILNLKNSTLAFPDIAFLLNDQSLPQLEPLGQVSLQGQFLGFPNDFVANGNFNSNIGRITSDINFKVEEGNFDKSIYSGKLALIDFDLGEYLNDTSTFQKVNVDGRIKGSGLKASNADFTLDGKVNSIGLKGYNYTNITTNARFASGFFSGALTINDPNLEFRAKGSIDLRQQKNIIKIQASLDTAFLQNLHLTKSKIFLQSDIDVNITGLQIDSLVGTANFKDFLIKYENEELRLKDIQLVSEKEGKHRTMNLATTLIDASVNGDFLFSDISDNMNALLTEVMLNIKNDKEEINQYYANKRVVPKEYEARFNIKLKNIKAITNLLDLDFGLSHNVVINGNFSSGNTTIFRVYSNIDTVHYNGTELYHTDIELTASKISDSTSVLAMAFINSDQQYFGPNFQTERLTVEGIWNNNHIDFGVDAEQTAQPNSVHLKGVIDFMKDSTRIKFLKSSLELLDRTWGFAPENYVVTNNREWHFKNVALQEAGQSISLNGSISDNPEKKLYLNVDKLDLSILSAIAGLKFKGYLDADVNLSNYYKNLYIENDVFIDSLTINNFLIGDITGKNLWDAMGNRFNINFFIDRLLSRIVNITGYYNPTDENSPLNLTANLEKANLKIIEPFLADIFSQWGGSISGEYHIGGKLNTPDFEGNGVITDGQVMINYLKTQYHFNGNVALTKNSLEFKQIELIDGFKNKAKLNGSIIHDNFTDPFINLTTTFQDFQVLNTSEKDNNPFYGSAYATGNANFFGPISNLKITATAKSEKKTRIFIPIGGTSSVEKKEFINFVSFTDSTFLKTLKKEKENKVNLSGLSFDLNLDITPDAYCEIIFDIKSGDIIRGSGNGDLQLQLDTKGEFNMFGLFEFTKGWYNFTLYDVINKEFEIQKGSQISWFGDPYAGNLNINASYNQLASFAPILSDQRQATAPQVRRKYPVQVILKLDGPMSAFTINFDITANDIPKNVIGNGGESIPLNIEFNAFKSKMDEQELKRQVFSLIILRRFSPPDQFNTSGSLANSVSELFSNQLSNWMSQVDQNLEIDVDFGSFDQEAFNAIQLRLSRTFLNGRLRITRDGTFNNNYQNSTNANSSTNVSTIAGDWTVEYLLTADGKLKIKMYNRTNVNPILSTIGTQNTFTTGASIFYTQSFNDIRDLLRGERSKNRKENEDAPETKKDIIKEEDDVTP